MSQEIDYTRYYRNWHDGSDEHHESMAQGWATTFAALLDAPLDAKIVDIGCGTGFAVAGLLKLGYGNVIGFDSDKGQIEEAKRRSLSVSHVPASQTVSWLSSHEGTFDVAMAFDVLEHIPVEDQIPFLRAIEKSLRPGGKFICQVPNSNSIVSSRFRWGDWTHHSSFTEHSIDFVLFNAGFENIAISETLDKRPRLASKAMGWWLARRFFRNLRRLQFAAEVGIYAAKKMPVSPNLMATCSTKIWTTPKRLN